MTSWPLCAYGGAERKVIPPLDRGRSRPVLARPRVEVGGGNGGGAKLLRLAEDGDNFQRATEPLAHARGSVPATA